MGSRNPPTDYTIRTRLQHWGRHSTPPGWRCRPDPFRDFERDSELKTAISQKLSMLAVDGVTDPIELREWALEGFLLR
jgi:hypothetical protein